jgi:hypothetical protein
MKPLTIPCQECMLIPICRHKRFLELIYDCSLIGELWRDSKFNNSPFWDNIIYAQDILQSTQWRIKQTPINQGRILYSIEQEIWTNETTNTTM